MATTLSDMQLRAIAISILGLETQLIAVAIGLKATEARIAEMEDRIKKMEMVPFPTEAPDWEAHALKEYEGQEAEQ
jgi:hypothetical protein